MTQPQNIVGSRIKQLRQQKKWSQAILAARCGVLGWEVSENSITKIETGIRCVTDRELVLLAEALKARLSDFFPDKPNLF